MILVIDENKNRFHSWILDVKKTVGGEDVIYHLVEQLAESLKHKKAIATYLEDFEEEQHIGYVTRELQRDRIQETISKKSAYIQNEKSKIAHMPVLIGAEARLKLLKEEAKLKIIVAFQKDYIEIGKSVYKLESHISVEQNGKYVYHLEAACFSGSCET